MHRAETQSSKTCTGLCAAAELAPRRQRPCQKTDQRQPGEGLRWSSRSTRVKLTARRRDAKQQHAGLGVGERLNVSPKVQHTCACPHAQLPTWSRGPGSSYQLHSEESSWRHQCHAAGSPERRCQALNGQVADSGSSAHRGTLQGPMTREASDGYPSLPDCQMLKNTVRN